MFKKIDNDNTNNTGDDMKYNSIWEDDNKISLNEKKLSNNVFDIVIVGGGITGVTLAYFLKDTNKNIVLIDKGRLSDNATSRSTAKISFLQQDIYQILEKNFNYEISKKYYESQIYAIHLIEQIIEENKIDCDFEKSNSYLFTTLKSKIKNVEKEKKLLTSFGRKCFEVDSLPIDFSTLKTFYVEDTYVFNPVKYLNCLFHLIKSKINIRPDTLVEEVTKEEELYVVKTLKGIIKAKQVVITNQYPFFITTGFIPFKNYIKREYVNAAKYKEKLNFNAINLGNELHSIRFYNNYLIYVSNKHRITNKLNTKENYQKSQDDFYHYFKLNPEYSWLNQDLMTNDHLPLIGEIKENLYLSTGYNAWGMTNGVLGAKIICDQLLENKNEFEELVKPDRISMVGLFHSIIDSLSYIKPYIESPFHNENIYTEEKDGITYNVYVDEEGNKHYVQRKCPHLKCNLIFNEKEKTWDCPCHGSRFHLDGELLEGPSKHDI